jgi:hypothetical protein
MTMPTTHSVLRSTVPASQLLFNTRKQFNRGRRASLREVLDVELRQFFFRDFAGGLRELGG